MTNIETLIENTEGKIFTVTFVKYEFTGRCPSKAQIVKQIKHGLATGNGAQVSWGENQITVEWTPYGITGSGWLRGHGGQDLANEIKRKAK